MRFWCSAGSVPRFDQPPATPSSSLLNDSKLTSRLSNIKKVLLNSIEALGNTPPCNFFPCSPLPVPRPQCTLGHLSCMQALRGISWTHPTTFTFIANTQLHYFAQLYLFALSRAERADPRCWQGWHHPAVPVHPAVQWRPACGVLMAMSPQSLAGGLTSLGQRSWRSRGPHAGLKDLCPSQCKRDVPVHHCWSKQ